MAGDFYCDEVLSGRTPVAVIRETADVLAFHHTRPMWPSHIVVTSKRHIESLLALGPGDRALLDQMIEVIQQVAALVVAEQGGCHVVTNLGAYQDSKHVHWHVYGGERLPS